MENVKFEYKTIKLSASHGFQGGKVDTEELNGRLNELGEMGWELVISLSTNMGFGESRDIIAIFKRIKIK